MQQKQARWDLDFMTLCLTQARQAEGRTAPNPMVGAIVVSVDGVVVGKGFHRSAGLEHAEVVALNEAKEAARGGTLYVNLEPCNHFGRTPPCAPLVIESGIKRVVIGMLDPHEIVAGAGIKALEEAGLDVVVGVLEDECRFLNRAFVKSVTEKKPWTILKMATTLDGKIADRNGKSRWVTGTEARQYVHNLRNKVDCVLVGRRTVDLDDPVLSVRDVLRGRDPRRAVLDSHLSTARESKIYKNTSGGPTTIFCLAEAAMQLEQQSEQNVASSVSRSQTKTQDKTAVKAAGPFPAHVSLVTAPKSDDESGLDLNVVFSSLFEQGVHSLLCEGGSVLAASLLKANLIDEVHWIIAPKIIGDVKAQASISSSKMVDLDDALELSSVKHLRLGDDMLIQGFVRKKL
jgi:diaminohydroxyphosphoribosylaminopyrimidine deaminase/5-amino-6-(5-phosphoribosylamino)uracil reductase